MLVERDKLDTELDVLCDEAQRAAMHPRAIEAAKQRVVRAFGNKFAPDERVPAPAFMRLARPASADALDNEDELSLDEACAQARAAWQMTIDEWPLWLYLLVRRIDDVLVARVPSLGASDARALYASLERAHPHLYIMEGSDTGRAQQGQPLADAVAQRIRDARLVCVPLVDTRDRTALLWRYDGALHFFAAPDGAVPHLASMARALQCEAVLASHTTVDALPFDDAMLIYLVAEGARLGDAFAELAGWMRFIDATTVAVVRARVLRTHFLQHFLAHEVIEIDDESAASQSVNVIEDDEPPVVSILHTSVTKLVRLLREEEDVSDAVLLDAVRYGLRAPPDMRIQDPAAWRDRMVARDEPLVLDRRLLLVPINNAAHWSLLILSAREAIYYSSWSRDQYGATVRQIVARSHPDARFRELEGPRQRVDRECSLYVLNMLQYVLDGGQLVSRVRIAMDQRKWSRASVQQLLLRALQQNLDDARVVAFATDELVNFARQDAVNADEFLALLRPLLARWPALLRAVERVARSGEVPQRATLEPALQALVAPRGDAHYYEMDDPVDALVQFVRALRDRVAQTQEKYARQPDLFDADFLGELRGAVAPLSAMDAFRTAALRSIDALFYSSNHRGQRQQLRVPDDARINDALECYRQYKK